MQQQDNHEYPSFISGRLATKSNQIKQLIRNGRSTNLQRTFNKTITSRITIITSIPPLSAADLPPTPTKSSNLSETAEVPACNVPSRSPLPALAIAPETKLGTASSGLGTLEP